MFTKYLRKKGWDLALQQLLYSDGKSRKQEKMFQMSNGTCERGGLVFFLSLGVYLHFKNQALPSLAGLSLRQHPCCFGGIREPHRGASELVSLFIWSQPCQSSCAVFWTFSLSFGLGVEKRIMFNSYPLVIEPLS